MTLRAARHGLRRHVDAVRAHVGDEADRLAADVDALVEALRQLHRLGAGEAELARASCCMVEVVKGGWGLRRAGFASTLATVKEASSSAARSACARSACHVEPAELLAVGADEPGGEGRTGRRLQEAPQRPVLAPDEFLDLQLALADEPQRHRLHPAGRARAGQLAPQHRGEGETDEVVERAAGQVGVDQRRRRSRAGSTWPPGRRSW